MMERQPGGKRGRRDKTFTLHTVIFHRLYHPCDHCCWVTFELFTGVRLGKGFVHGETLPSHVPKGESCLNFCNGLTYFLVQPSGDWLAVHVGRRTFPCSVFIIVCNI